MKVRFAWRRRPRKERPLSATTAEIMLAMHEVEYKALCAIFGLPDYTVLGSQAHIVAGVEESFEYLDGVMREKPKPGRAGE